MSRLASAYARRVVCGRGDFPPCFCHAIMAGNERGESRVHIDLNSDMGESFGPWPMGETASLMTLVTSANVACGFHAGDPRVMAATVALAARHGVAVGAHVGYPDLVGFGRRPMTLSRAEIATDVLYQIGALFAFVREAGLTLQHVKAHGALYNQAERDAAVAEALVEGVRRFSCELVVVAPAASAMAAAAQAAGLPVAREAFCDRAYRADGTLAPRGRAGSVLTDPTEVARRAVRMVTEGRVETVDGADIAIPCDTLCIHSDTSGATEMARAVRAALTAAGVRVAAFGRPAADRTGGEAR